MVRPSSRDGIATHFIISLKTDLDGVESRCSQLLSAGQTKTKSASDKIGIQSRLVCACDYLRQILPEKRFASR